jgi:hypothetical protein
LSSITARYRHQVLPSDVTPAALDAALIVTFSGAAEPSLEGIVRGEGGEPRAQDPRRTDEHLGHGRRQVVVGDRGDHAGEVRERGDMRRQKPGGVLLRAEHREVAPRVHQTHQKQPRLLANAGEFDPDLEEVDLGDFTGAVHQRHRDLPLGASEFGHEPADRALAGCVAGLAQ